MEATALRWSAVDLDRGLRAIQPLRVSPADSVFRNVEGRPIEPTAFPTHWYRCLRSLGIRVQGLPARACRARRPPRSGR